MPLSFFAALTLEEWEELTVKWRLERGASIPAPGLPELEELHVPRDTEKQRLLRLFSSKGVDELPYLLLQGPHAQGKTTLVRQVLREGLETTKGAIYVEVPVDGTRRDLARAISKSMNYDPAAWYYASWPEIVFFPALLDRKGKRDDLALYQKKLVGLAKWFKAKHKRPMLLVIDNVNKLAQHDPSALESLRSFAKSMADERLIRVIFVTSDGLAPKQLKEGNRSRMETVEMQDITLEQAKTLLRNTVEKASDELINRVVCELTGGRIGNAIRARRVMADKFASTPGVSEDEVYRTVETKMKLEAGGEADIRLSTKEAYKLAGALLARHASLPPEQKCDVVNNATLTFVDAVALLGTKERVRELCAGNTFWVRDDDELVSFQSAIAAHLMRKELNVSKEKQPKLKELDDLDAVIATGAANAAARATKP